MLLLITFCVAGSGAISFCVFVIYFKKRQANFCHTVDELYDTFLTYKEKYSFIPLTKSTANEKIVLLQSNKTKKLFCEKYLYKKLDFLYTVSRFIDFKLNSNKQLFRSKNYKILIEEIASVVAWSVVLSDKCKLFELYKKLNLQYNLRSKENKIFKLLLGQKLIYLLFEIECETIEIAKIVARAKTIKKVKHYKKKLYFWAELYGIKKFNKNSTKLLSKYRYNYTKIAASLLFELDEIAKKQKIIISYLITMFE